jgi:Glycosyl-4,4'-diaponeurosporenoate acyltransferase
LVHSTMKKLRDLIVLLVVAAVFAVTLALLGSAVGFASPWFALTAMFDILGLIAFARPLYLLKLPGFLRKERDWETNGRLYRLLGVPAFGALLRRTPLRYLNAFVYLKHCPDLSIVQAHIESSDAAHLLAGTLIVPYMVYAGIQGWWSAVAWITLVQIAFNLYPILHLRWVRVRLNRLHDRVAFNRNTI